MTIHCAICNADLGEEVSEEGKKEYEANFPGQEFSPGDNCEALCSDCYKEFWEWAEHNAPELERKHGH